MWTWGEPWGGFSLKVGRQPRPVSKGLALGGGRQGGGINGAQPRHARGCTREGENRGRGGKWRASLALSARVCVRKVIGSKWVGAEGKGQCTVSLMISWFENTQVLLMYAPYGLPSYDLPLVTWLQVPGAVGMASIAAGAFHNMALSRGGQVRRGEAQRAKLGQRGGSTTLG